MTYLHFNPSRTPRSKAHHASFSAVNQDLDSYRGDLSGDIYSWHTSSDLSSSGWNSYIPLKDDAYVAHSTQTQPMDPPTALQRLFLHQHTSANTAAQGYEEPLSEDHITQPGLGSSRLRRTDEEGLANESSRRGFHLQLPLSHGIRSRPPGACTRCKKVKMRCTFGDSDSQCARCLVGGYECIVTGRKPRSPGMRDILRRQIKEKDTMIDELLNRLNPSPHLATPLAIAPTKLALTSEQRLKHQGVLAWLEKYRVNSRVTNELRNKVDVSALEDPAVSDDSMDEQDEEDEEADGEVTEALLRQLNFAPAGPAPAGILASAALSCRSQDQTPASTEAQEARDLKVEGGIGSKSYFQPGPAANLELRKLIVERQAGPEILLSGLITYEDAGKLFDIYFKTVNYYVPILDENIHTPGAVLGRCPFLFTVMCTLASRYYDEKPEIYALAVHMAKAAAGNAFLGGWKSVEMCQAYLLLGAYSPPARRWEEDRSWFYSGLCFRLALELNLNRIPDVKPTDERNQRELLNRIRTWIVCYVMDRCICVNLGKPFMMPEDQVIRSAADKLLGWTYHQPGDIYLVCLAELLRIITRFSETVNPVFEHNDDLRQESDLMTLHKVAETELTAWKNSADERYEKSVRSDSVGHALQLGLMNSVYHYIRLVTFSVGLQQVIRQKTLEQDETFFVGCLDAACAVVDLMLTDIIPTGLIRCSPEHVFTLSAFATAVLIKFLRRQFAFKMDNSQNVRIIALVRQLLDALDAGHQSLDEHHAARRYARFLKSLLDPYLNGILRRDFSESPEAPAHTSRTLEAISSRSGPDLSYDPEHIPTPATNQLRHSTFYPTPKEHSYAPHRQEHPAMLHAYGNEGMMHTSHSIWDDTLSSSDTGSVPMPPILAYPDPLFLASMFSYDQQVAPANLF